MMPVDDASRALGVARQSRLPCPSLTLRRPRCPAGTQGQDAFAALSPQSLTTKPSGIAVRLRASERSLPAWSAIMAPSASERIMQRSRTPRDEPISPSPVRLYVTPFPLMKRTRAQISGACAGVAWRLHHVATT
jgi:hypothetical protein